jgi:hypothetical protein
VIGISENLIRQYLALYRELNVPEYQRTLDRLRRIVFELDTNEEEDTAPPHPDSAPEEGKKGVQV